MKPKGHTDVDTYFRKLKSQTTNWVNEELMKTPEQRLIDRLREESSLNTESYIHLINNYLPCLGEDQLFKVLQTVKEYVDEAERQSALAESFPISR